MRQGLSYKYGRCNKFRGAVKIVNIWKYELTLSLPPFFCTEIQESAVSSNLAEAFFSHECYSHIFQRQMSFMGSW